MERRAVTIGSVVLDGRRAAVTGVELIAAALAAGAAAGITDTTSGAMRDAYVGLRELVRRRLAGRAGQAVQALDMADTDPVVWEARLGEELAGSGTDRDDEVLAAARQLLARLDPAGAQAGKYSVDLREAKGVMVGDQNAQTNFFS
jgi:hypothetical protein